MDAELEFKDGSKITGLPAMILGAPFMLLAAPFLGVAYCIGKTVEKAVRELEAKDGE